MIKFNTRTILSMIGLIVMGAVVGYFVISVMWSYVVLGSELLQFRSDHGSDIGLMGIALFFIAFALGAVLWGGHHWLSMLKEFLSMATSDVRKLLNADNASKSDDEK